MCNFTEAPVDIVITAAAQTDKRNMANMTPNNKVELN